MLEQEYVVIIIQNINKTIEEKSLLETSVHDLKESEKEFEQLHWSINNLGIDDILLITESGAVDIVDKGNDCTPAIEIISKVTI